MSVEVSKLLIARALILIKLGRINAIQKQLRFSIKVAPTNSQIEYFIKVVGVISKARYACIQIGRGF
jgi:hypothetical protein